jgi:hypothetical protein
MNAITTEVSISAIAAFSADGHVYRAYGHLLATRPGELLLVPLGRTSGDLRQITDGCPVPWAEAWAALDTSPEGLRAVDCEEMCARFPALATISPYGWEADNPPMFLNHPADFLRLRHVSGICFVRVQP